MKVIDAHVHLAERFSGYGSRGEARAMGNGMIRWANGEEVQMVPPALGDYGFKAGQLLQLMDEHGVEKAVLVEGVGQGFQNDYIAQVVNEHPTRFAGTGILDPYCGQAQAILSRIIDDFQFNILKFEISDDNGLGGIHKDISLTMDEMRHIWQQADRLGMTVILDIGRLTVNARHIDAISEVIGKYDGLKIVVAHLLAPYGGQEDELKRGLEKLKHDRIWFDLAALPWFLEPEPYPYLGVSNYVDLAKNIVGIEKMIWGSDLPIVLTRETYGNLINYLEKSGLFSERELAMLFRENAIKAFNL